MNFINVHVLKSYSVSNLNRDRAGSPKECNYGGVTRGRRSSQNIKFTIRHSDLFRLQLAGESGEDLPQILAYRTRDIGALMDTEKGKEIMTMLGGVDFLNFLSEFFTTDEIKIYADSEVEKIANTVLNWVLAHFAGPKEGSFDKDALFEFVGWATENVKNKSGARRANKKFVQPKCSDAQKEIIKSMDDLYKEIAGIVGSGMTIDIALFGRMVADDQCARTDGSFYAAHAITTHEVRTESDFFTAVDDLNQNGSAHINDAEYNTGCYYEYFGIDTDALKRNLKDFNLSDDAIRTIVKAVVIAALMETSKSKQNSMASNPRPSVVYVEKTLTDYTYAGAFECPVQMADGGGFDRPSAITFKNDIELVARKYDIFPTERLWFSKYDDIKIDPEFCTNCETLKDLIERI